MIDVNRYISPRFPKSQAALRCNFHKICSRKHASCQNCSKTEHSSRHTALSSARESSSHQSTTIQREAARQKERKKRNRVGRHYGRVLLVGSTFSRENRDFTPLVPRPVRVRGRARVSWTGLRAFSGAVRAVSGPKVVSENFRLLFFLVSSSRRICGRGLAHFDWAVVVSPFFFSFIPFSVPFSPCGHRVCVFVCTWMGCRGRYQKATAGGCRPEKAGDDDRDGLWSIITQEEEEKFETPKRGPSGENQQLRNVKWPRKRAVLFVVWFDFSAAALDYSLSSPVGTPWSWIGQRAAAYCIFICFFVVPFPSCGGQRASVCVFLYAVHTQTQTFYTRFLLFVSSFVASLFLGPHGQGGKFCIGLRFKLLICLLNICNFHYLK